jgi:hypothetical protein
MGKCTFPDEKCTYHPYEQKSCHTMISWRYAYGKVQTGGHSSMPAGCTRITSCRSPRISSFSGTRGDPPPSLNNQPRKDNFYGAHRILCYGSDERSLFTAVADKSSLFIKLIPTKSSIHTVLIIAINLLYYSSLR